MFDAIGLLLFGFIVLFVAWYGGMYLMYLLWNNKCARKARKDAIEALINAEKFLRDIEEKEVRL